jgi:hypothetical protein
MLIQSRHIVFKAFVLILSTTFSWNCRPDVEEFRPFPVSMAGVDSLLRNATIPTSTTDFKQSGALPDTMISTKNGIRVGLKDTEKLFTDDNGKVIPCSTCKSFSLEITEVAKRGDAIGRGINTLTTNGKMLEAGGILFLEAVCDGKKLRLKGDKTLQLQIPAKGVQLNNLDNFVGYQGVVKEKTFVGWEPTGEKALAGKWPVPGSANPAEAVGLEIKTRTLDWIMLSRTVEGAAKPMRVLTPQGFNGNNTQVYVVLKEIQAFAKLEYDESRKVFVFEQMPVGQPATVLVIGKSGNKSLLGSITVDDKTDFSVPLKIVPKETPQQQILNFLNSL